MYMCDSTIFAECQLIQGDYFGFFVMSSNRIHKIMVIIEAFYFCLLFLRGSRLSHPEFMF